ncbi:TlpA disulfide reductase family protein [Nocardioides sp.]|uniref:TlpA disulfide reductase family protein n=1 Tax=Nocardioides sp. TaxID=35761 RepID=UPI0039E6C2F4
MRRLLVPLFLLPTVLTACSGLSGTNKGGYITGNGAITTWTADKRGEPVEISGTTLDGTSYDVADDRGKSVVINVWWSGCGYCVSEMPLLEQAHQSLADKADFLGINTRDSSVANGLAFERSAGATYPSLYAPDGKVLLALKGLPRSMPATVVLDPEGRIAATVSGEITGQYTVKSLVECADGSGPCEIDS